MAQTEQQSLLTARVIAAAFMGGVAMSWVMVWVITGGGRDGLASGSFTAQQAFWIWAGIALPGFMASLVVRGRATRFLESVAGIGGAGGPSTEQRGRVQTLLIIAWALLEGPALLGGVFFLLTNAIQIPLAAVPLYLIGMAVTFPRAEWFGAGLRSGAGLYES